MKQPAENTIQVDEARSASFRDPSGFVFRHEGTILRQVNGVYRADYERLMTSGLYEALTTAGLLIDHEEVELGLARSSEAYKVIRPRPVDLISYPYEWCFSQLKDAAAVTLRVQRLAIEHGMSLKDASAYNIQLSQGRPLLIDSLSFEELREDQPWIAYRQFCQHFLAPLALMSRKDVRLNRLAQVFIDGVPLDLASSMLPWHTRFTMSMGMHIHAHARAQEKYADRLDVARRRDRGFSRRRLELVLASLEAAVEKMNWRPLKSAWVDYYDNKHNYGAEGLAEKEAALCELLDAVAPGTCWDLGANTGRFSRLASARGAATVAWDFDPSCVEASYLQVRRDSIANLTPLVQDLTNPSGGIGWANAERQSLVQRGPVDMLLALGLVHHLIIANNVPAQRVGEFFSGLCHHLVVEFVPREDSQVQRLLAGRKDVFHDYTLEEFCRAMCESFRIERRIPLPRSGRTLLLMHTRRN